MSAAGETIATGAGGLVSSLSGAVGAPEPALRLLISILLGYPIVVIYRTVVVDLPSKALHHLFFASCGLSLCFFNYGYNTYHSLVAVWTTYTLLQVLRNAPRLFLTTNFIFHMSYLLIGYYYTASEEYDILWTMPHCVLVLRLIGFGFDVMDGQKPREELSKDQQDTALEELPNLLETTAYAYFPFSFLIGPQFPYRRYKRFIEGEFRQYEGCIEAGIKRMLLGVLYLVVRQLGAMWLPDDYFLSDEFREKAFLLRIVYLGLWGKFAFYKYISCWLLVEGALMCIGFTWSGKTADGKDDWTGCANVKLFLFETGTVMNHYVLAFNVNTNQWVARYIYKRLKFLNNRTISYASALIFLAIWHGFHSGYYMAFLLEYLTVTAEKQIQKVYEKAVLPKYGELLNQSQLYKGLKLFTLKSYNIIYMGFCLSPFIFLSYDRWSRVFSAVNYFGLIYLGTWFAVHEVYKFMSSRSARSERAATSSDRTRTAANGTKED